MPSVCFFGRRHCRSEGRRANKTETASGQLAVLWQAWLCDLTVRRSYGKYCKKVTRKREARTRALWGSRHSELLASTPDTTHARAPFLSWPARPFTSSQLGLLESPEPKRDWLRPPAATC